MSHAAPAPSAPLPLQPQRIVATSLVLTLHLAAFGLLLAPLAQHTPADTPPQRTQVQWQAVELAPPPPPPPVMPLTPTRSPPAAVATALPEPLSLPVVVDNVDTAALIQAASALHQRLDLGLPEPALTAAPVAAGQPLQVLQAPAPAYPAQALMRQLQGEVLLRVHLDAQGKVVAVDIERSSGHRVLDQAARTQVLRRWQFAPASIDGIARPAQGLVPINFRIDG